MDTIVTSTIAPYHKCKEKIQPFLLKVVESINDKANENRPKPKLKSLYKISKDKCLLKYGTTRFQPHHMNSIMVET